MRHEAVDQAGTIPQRRASDHIFDRVIDAIGKIGIPAAICAALLWIGAGEARQLRSAVEVQGQKLDQVVEILKEIKQEVRK